LLPTAVAPSAGTGTVDVTVTAAAGTSPVDTTKDSFTYGTNLALLATASASNTEPGGHEGRLPGELIYAYRPQITQVVEYGASADAVLSGQAPPMKRPESFMRLSIRPKRLVASSTTRCAVSTWVRDGRSRNQAHHLN
jgi:hypothetical protein